MRSTECVLNKCWLMMTSTGTHTHIHICTHVNTCICVCVCSIIYVIKIDMIATKHGGIDFHKFKHGEKAMTLVFPMSSKYTGRSRMAS